MITSCSLFKLFKGQVSREFGVISKTPKLFFFFDRNLKVLLRFVVDDHSSIILVRWRRLWPQMDWARMDCNLKKVRLTVLAFSFPKCTRAGHELLLSRIQ